MILLAVAVAGIGLAWVPLRVEPDPVSALFTGAGSGDGRFTIVVCCVAILSP